MHRSNRTGSCQSAHSTDKSRQACVAMQSQNKAQTRNCSFTQPHSARGWCRKSKYPIALHRALMLSGAGVRGRHSTSTQAFAPMSGSRQTQDLTSLNSCRASRQAVLLGGRCCLSHPRLGGPTANWVLLGHGTWLRRPARHASQVHPVRLQAFSAKTPAPATCASPCSAPAAHRMLCRQAVHN